MKSTLHLALVSRKKGAGLLDKKELLREINKDLPPGVDWKRGAERYVENVFKVHDRPAVDRYIRTKPMFELPRTAAEAERPLEETVQYLYNFVNSLKLLKLPAGARFLDVACGGGWMSHYARRFGYETFGFDISEDFIVYARERLRRDPDLILDEAAVDASFAVHDIESAPLSAEHRGRYDAVLVESCLHHFLDPIAALTHLAEALSDTGVVVIIEGENRQGPLNPAYMDVMRQFDTLERPYFRKNLHQALVMAGLPYIESVGELNGFFSPRDPVWGDAANRLRETVEHKNLTICGKTAAALARIFPFLA